MSARTPTAVYEAAARPRREGRSPYDRDGTPVDISYVIAHDSPDSVNHGLVRKSFNKKLRFWLSHEVESRYGRTGNKRARIGAVYFR